MNIFECNRNCYNDVKKILENSMTWFHTYYALWCLEVNVCRALVAYEEKAVGVGIFYKVPNTKFGVIYYVSVLPEYRRRGVGKAIVSSIEELLNNESIDVFLATTRRDNVSSRRMLKDLGYTEIAIDNLDEDIRDIVTMMTCGYEDDLLYIKTEGLPLEMFFEILVKPDTVNSVEKLWRIICYAPWARIRRSKS